MKRKLRNMIRFSLVVFLGVFLSGTSFGQAYYITNSGLNAGNPGGVNTNADYTSGTGYTTLLDANTGGAGTNVWSATESIPFTFEFYGTAVTHFIVNKNGLISFDTTLTGTTVASNLDSNTALPNPNLPNNTIAGFWEDFSGVSFGDNVRVFTVGTAPNRQLWIHYYSYKRGPASYVYYAVVLEETTNNIYVVDMNYNSGGTSLTSTVGVQVNSSTGFMATSGLHTTDGSPLISSNYVGSGNTDNGYYLFDFIPAGVLIPPYAVSATNVTATSADINWSIYSPATMVDIEYGPAGFTQGGGSSTTITGSTASPTALTSLSQATAYDFYIRSASSTASSAWQGPYSFTTACLVQSLPYSESFTTWVPPCIDPTLGTTNWLHNSAGYAYADFWSVNGGIYIMEFPDVDITADARLKFDWSSNLSTSYTDTLYVEGTLDNGATWQTIWVKGSSDLATISGGSNTTLNAGSWVTEKINLDPLVYTGDTLKIRFRGISDWGPNVFIDNVIIEQLPACPEPSFDNFSNITSTSADISYIGPGSAFSLEVGPAGFTQGTGLTFTSSTNTASMTGLSPNVTYDVYVQNDCTPLNGYSIWEGPFTFTTLPAPTYLTDFASYYPSNLYEEAEGLMGDTLTYGSSYWFTDGYLNNGFNGAISCYFYSSTFYIPQEDWYVTTPIDLGAGGSYEMHIDVGVTRDATTAASLFETDDTLRIGISTDGGVTFTELANFNQSNQPNEIGATYTFNLTAYSGVVRFGFMVDNPVANSDDADGYPQVHIDNFGVRPIPACPDPSVFTALSVTDTSVTMGWDTTGVGAVSYTVEYNAVGAVQGTGTTFTTTADSVVVNGLLPATQYDFWIQSDCSVSTSSWVGPITVTTACPSAFMAPYFEDFEGITLGADQGTGWENCFYANPLTGYRWESEVSPTANSSSTGPYYDHTLFGSTGGNYMYTEATSTGPDAMLYSPMIDLSGLTQPALYFWYHMYGSTMSDLNVEIWDGTTWTNVLSISGEQQTADTDPWLEAALPLQAYIGQTIQIRFRGTRGSNFYGDLSIDDVKVDEAVPCMGVSGGFATNVTTSSADLNWSGYGTTFNVEWGAQGFNQGSGTGTLISSTTNPTSITGLTENTYYDFYVNDPCAPGTWFGPYTFKTPCTSALSGTYTVGGTSGPNNFGTLDSAVARLVGCGISGPVTFNIMNTSDTTMVYLPEIEGSSATNTITFDGMNTYSLYASGNAYGAFYFDGADYVTVQNMNITNMATANAHAIVLMNNSDHINIDNNTIMVDTTLTTSTVNPVASTSSMTSSTGYGADVDYVSVTNNVIKGGYYGVVFNGSSSTDNDSLFVVENNTFVKQYYYGISAYYTDSVLIRNNSISDMRNTFTYGVYCYYCDGSEISSNYVNSKSYGIYTYYYSQEGGWSRGLIQNNMSIGTSTAGLYLSSAAATDVFHNTFSGTRGLYSFNTANAGHDIRNNIFVGSLLAADFGTTLDSASNTVDYNLYYSGGANLVEASSAYADLLAWQTAQPFFNANSVEGDPVFVSTEDLHVVGSLPNDVGDATVGVLVDIDGDVRPAVGSTGVDMGADEYTPLNYDVKVNGMVVPLGGCGDSATEVSLIIENQGLLDATSFTVSVNVTGGVSASLTSPTIALLPAGQVDTVLVGSFNTYAGPQGVSFVGYSTYAADQDNSNDTTNVSGANYLPVEPQFYPVDSVCLTTDSVNLAALNTGQYYSWYDAATGGNLIGQGDTVTVPTNGPTTYYLGVDTSSAMPVVGTGTSLSTSTAYTPYGTFYMDNRHQYLILASELAAMGVTAGQLNSIAFEAGPSPAAQAMSNFEVKIGGTSLTSMSGFVPGSSLTPVYSANYVAVSGWNTHMFTTPYFWNGSDNIIVEVCFDNSAYTSNSAVYVTTTSFQSSVNGIGDLSATSGCVDGNLTGTASNIRPNMQLDFTQIPCTAIRTPVTIPVDTTVASASFTWAEDLPSNPGTVNFDASGSVGADAYIWDFGNGSTGTGMMTSNSYAVGDSFLVTLVVVDSSCGSTDTVTQWVLSTIGLEETLLNSSLQVYPNPTVGNFMAEFTLEGIQQVRLRVMNSLGQIISERNVGKISGSYRAEFDLGDKPKGVYILQIQTDDQVVNRRITLQ